VLSCFEKYFVGLRGPLYHFNHYFCTFARIRVANSVLIIINNRTKKNELCVEHTDVLVRRETHKSLSWKILRDGRRKNIKMGYGSVGM
jgi:hypothetical protein